MNEPDVRILPDADACSATVAAWIADRLTDAVRQRGRADWATTGGSTPVGIYRILAAPPFRESVPWASVHLWWGDDRFVTRDHPFSNIVACDQVLLGTTILSGPAPGPGSGIVLEVVKTGVAIPPDHLHAIPIDAAIAAGRSIDWAAAEYERTLRAANLELAPSGFPMLDVVLVGVGVDGHIFSIFPDSPAWESDAWVLGIPAPTHIGPHVARVSLHPGILAAARGPLAVVHGAGKAEILATIFGPDRDERRWPAQVARRAGATWFLDRAVAAHLPAPWTPAPG